MRIIILIVLTNVALSSSWACVPSENSCDYYLCKEDDLNCGKNGYLKKFAYKYCHKFKNREKRLSLNAQDWSHKTTLCLQEKFDKLSFKYSCKKLKKLSFKSHLGCYVESGFCSLSTRDKRDIIKIIWPSLFNLRTISQVIKISKLCRSNYAN